MKSPCLFRFGLPGKSGQALLLKTGQATRRTPGPPSRLLCFISCRSRFSPVRGRPLRANGNRPIPCEIDRSGQPLPRCFICLQQMGSLNPETEARRRQFDQLKGKGTAAVGSSSSSARVRGGHTGGGGRFGNRGLPQREQGAPQAALNIWWSWCNV